MIDRSKITKLLGWIMAIGLLGVAVCFLGIRDSHDTNFRYLTWKYGRAPQDYKWCLHLMMVDRDFRKSLKGKSMDQLRTWLPETAPPEPGSWQGDWLKGMDREPNVTFEVIGGSDIAVRLRDGKFDTAFPMKG